MSCNSSQKSISQRRLGCSLLRALLSENVAQSLSSLASNHAPLPRHVLRDKDRVVSTTKPPPGDSHHSAEQSQLRSSEDEGELETTFGVARWASVRRILAASGRSCTLFTDWAQKTDAARAFSSCHQIVSQPLGIEILYVNPPHNSLKLTF